MRQKKVWRYYCDFCRKAGCGKPSIRDHEVHCTKNPDRVCGACVLGGVKQKPITELLAAFEDYSLDDLKVAANGCPACVLAALRQDPRDRDPEEQLAIYEFDFKDEMGKWTDTHFELSLAGTPW